MNKKNGELYAVFFENKHSIIPSLVNFEINDQTRKEDYVLKR